MFAIKRDILGDIDDGIVRLSDNVYIPSDPENADWQAYQVWLSAGNTPTPAPPVPLNVPQIISDRQFFQQLAIMGIITQSEAKAAMAAVIPSELQTLVNSLPAAEQFGAEMMISGATQFERNSDITLAIGAANGWTAAQLDALWISAAAL